MDCCMLNQRGGIVWHLQSRRILIASSSVSLAAEVPLKWVLGEDFA